MPSSYRMLLNLWDLISEPSLKVVNHGLKHIPVGGQASWIVLMFVNGGDRVLATGANMPNFHSVHAQIEVTLETFLPSNLIQQLSFRNFKGITG